VLQGKGDLLAVGDRQSEMKSTLIKGQQQGRGMVDLLVLHHGVAPEIETCQEPAPCGLHQDAHAPFLDEVAPQGANACQEQKYYHPSKGQGHPWCDRTAHEDHSKAE
jgi:hypothetical protein